MHGRAVIMRSDPGGMHTEFGPQRSSYHTHVYQRQATLSQKVR